MSTALAIQVRDQFRHPFSRDRRRQAVIDELRLNHDWSDRRLARKLGLCRDTIGIVRKRLVESGQIPTAVSRYGSDGKTYTRAGVPRETVEPATPSEPAEPTIDEMLAMMTKQVLEVIALTRGERFIDAYKTAGANARGLFQTAAIKLASRADQLRRL